MKILEINGSDLPGRLFNGYDLHHSLNERGYTAYQIVREKFSNDETVYEIETDRVCHLQLKEWERMNSVSHVMIPYGDWIQQQDIYKKADVVHCHILHNHTVSLFDYEALLGDKRSVWTIHDPWIFTGNCIHPLDCDKWRSGCNNCDRLHKDTFDMDCDNTAFMWKLKKEVLKRINPYVVVATIFMKKFLKESPFTQHFDKIRIIPFGIRLDQYSLSDKMQAKMTYRIPHGNTVIGFRADNLLIKGCKYLYQALDNIDENISLICVGSGTVPKHIKERFSVIELGWINHKEEMLRFFASIDIFVMPSLAEGFGLMAIEAMASGCAVICFEGTTVADITEAPRCGVKVRYQSAEDLRRQIERLINDKDEMRYRGLLGRKLVEEKFDYNRYVKQHIELYEEVCKNSK